MKVFNQSQKERQPVKEAFAPDYSPTAGTVAALLYDPAFRADYQVLGKDHFRVDTDNFDAFQKLFGRMIQWFKPGRPVKAVRVYGSSNSSKRFSTPFMIHGSCKVTYETDVDGSYVLNCANSSAEGLIPLADIDVIEVGPDTLSLFMGDRMNRAVIQLR